MVSQKSDRNNEVQEEYVGTSFKRAFKTLNFISCVNRAGFVKRSGISASAALQMLLMMSFGLGSTVNSFCTGSHSPSGITSKSALHAILENASFNWRKLLNLLALRFIATTVACRKKSKKAGINFLVVDSSCLYRNRSKHTEMLSYCYDHAKGVYYKGFQLISLVQTDGVSCIPFDFSLSASENRVCEESDDSVKHDRRSSSYLKIKEALSKMTDVTKSMIKRALAQGVPADYLLFDSWFCYHSFIQEIHSLGINIICMLKDMRCNKYYLKQNDNVSLSLKQLIEMFTQNKHCGKGTDIYNSAVVYTKTGLKVKLVFTRHKENPDRVLVLCSTDTTLTAEEICSFYAERWCIESLFKVEKQLLGLEKDCRARKFDAVWAHVALVQMRVILIEQIRREEENSKSHYRVFDEQCEENCLISVIRALREIHTKSTAAVKEILRQYISDKKQCKEAFEKIQQLTLSILSRSLPSYVREVFYKEILLPPDRPALYDKSQCIFLKSSNPARELRLSKFPNPET